MSHHHTHLTPLDNIKLAEHFGTTPLLPTFPILNALDAKVIVFLWDGSLSPLNLGAVCDGEEDAHSGPTKPN